MPLLYRLVLLVFLACGPALAQGAPPPLTRIAFGSCADEEKPQPIWDAVLAYRPELFLFTGDNVYGDVRNGRNVPEPELIESLQQSYTLAAKVPGLALLRSTVPHLATWDDHDYGKNDAGADFAGRQDAQRLFLQFWDVPLGRAASSRGRLPCPDLRAGRAAGAGHPTRHPLLPLGAQAHRPTWGARARALPA